MPPKNCEYEPPPNTRKAMIYLRLTHSMDPKGVKE